MPGAGDPRETRAARTVRRAGLAVTAAVAAAALGLGVLRIAAGDTILEYVEGIVFASVERFAEGGFTALYPPIPEARPFLLSPYTPGFYLEWAAVRAALGLTDSVLPGRLVALLALLGCAGILAAALRRTVSDRSTALLFALAWLASRYVVDHAGFAISDLAAIVWSVAGVYVVGRRWSAGRAVWPAVFAFAAALLTKQSAVAGLVAATAFLIFSRRSRQAAVLLGGTLAIVTAVGLLADAATAGGFARAVLGSQRQPIVRSLFLTFVHDFVATPLTWVVVPLAAVAATAALRRPGWNRLAVLYAGCALAVAFAISGKIGAANYYYLEAMLALCWAAGAGFDRLARLGPRRWPAVGTTAVALAALATLPVLMRGVEQAKRFSARARAAERALRGEDLRGWVLGEYYYFPAVERAGGGIYVNDVYVYGIFWESGHWPVKDVASDLACGRVATVLTSYPLGRIDPPLVTPQTVRWWRWGPWRSPALAPLILESYELQPGPEQRPVYLYRPRSRNSC